jgi:hypothetical protein
MYGFVLLNRDSNDHKIIANRKVVDQFIYLKYHSASYTVNG